MTQDEMDNDQLEAGAMLSKTRLTVDRSRHESVFDTALWFMDGAVQRGSAHRTPNLPSDWRCSRMYAGMPTSERLFDTLADVVEHIVSGDPERFKRVSQTHGTIIQTRDDSRFRVVKVTGKVR